MTFPANLRCLDDSSPRSIQPRYITRELYPHQLAALHVASKLESSWNINIVNQHGETVYLTTNTATLADEPGYGKTMIAIAIAGLPDPVEKPHIYGNSANIDYDNDVCYVSMFHKHELNSVHGNNLVIVPKILIRQWDAELRHTTLKFETIIDKNQFNKVIKRYENMEHMIKSLDILVITDVFLKAYFRNPPFKLIQTVFWKRVFIDEFHNLNSMKRYVSSRFFWSITGTPGCQSYYPSNRVLVKSSEKFLTDSYSMPAVIFTTYKVTLGGIFSKIYNMLDTTTQVMISTGDFQRAFRRISDATKTIVSSESEVLECMQRDIDENIRQLTELIHMLESQPRNIVDKKYIELNKKRLTDMETRKRVFENISLDSRECPICMVSLDESQVTLTTECGHTFCFDCILRSLKMKTECPVCRHILSDNIVIKQQNESQIHPNDEQLRTKDDILQKILENSEQKKFLVYSGNREQLYDFQAKYSSETLKCMYLKYYKPDDIQLYVNGNVNVMFITDDLLSGIDLTCTTDLVMFSQVSPAKEKQLLGRCNRLGRRHPLNVHRIVNQYERCTS